MGGCATTSARNSSDMEVNAGMVSGGGVGEGDGLPDEVLIDGVGLLVAVVKVGVGMGDGVVVVNVGSGLTVGVGSGTSVGTGTKVGFGKTGVAGSQPTDAASRTGASGRSLPMPSGAKPVSVVRLMMWMD